jgi:uncharacterized phage-associated protein
MLNDQSLMIGMKYSAITVANVFITIAEREGKVLTNMKLQKLVYMAHGFGLAFDKPLIKNEVHAWKYGPVIPQLYKMLAKYGAGTVTELIPSHEPDMESTLEAFEIIKRVWNGYGKFSGGQLSAITHEAGSPWSQTWLKENFSVIPEDLIAKHYRDLMNAPA